MRREWAERRLDEEREAVRAAVHGAPLPCRVIAPALVGAALIGGDLLAFGVSASLAQLLREALLGGPMPHSETLLSAALLWLALRFYEELYPGYGLAGPEELRRATWTTVVAGLGHAAVLFAVKEGDASRFLAMGTWGLLLVVNWLVRAWVKALLIRVDLFNCPVIIGGSGEIGALAVQELKANRALGFVPVAVFDDDATRHGKDLHGVPILGRLSAALTIAYPYPVDHAIIAMPGAHRHVLVETAQRFAKRYPKLGVVPDLFGLANLWVSPRCFGALLTLEIHNNLLRPANRRAKRALDLAVSAPLLILALPVMTLAGLAVKLASPGPVFYRQEREGLDGRTISVLKLRTMVPDAEARLGAYLARNSVARAQWEQYMKLPHDPRIVPIVGAWLRRFSADELPQFLNVLKGEMSLVGPRPFPEYHLQRFSPEFRDLRRQVPAGVTGLWQVSHRSSGDLTVQEAADSYYIRNWSIWLDLWLLFRTVRVVVQGKGAC